MKDTENIFWFIDSVHIVFASGVCSLLTTSYLMPKGKNMTKGKKLIMYVYVKDQLQLGKRDLSQRNNSLQSCINNNLLACFFYFGSVSSSQMSLKAAALWLCLLLCLQQQLTLAAPESANNTQGCNCKSQPTDEPVKMMKKKAKIVMLWVMMRRFMTGSCMSG
jgi:hypothetical protein